MSDRNLMLFESQCRVCGCTESVGCPPSGCCWAEPDLCSKCVVCKSCKRPGMHPECPTVEKRYQEMAKTGHVLTLSRRPCMPATKNAGGNMRVLTLIQPWATAIAVGLKRWETRSWSTSYRGPVAIQASKAFPAWAQGLANEFRRVTPLPVELPLGAILCVANLSDCKRTEDVRKVLDNQEILYGDYTPGRFALKLDDVKQLREPVPCKGSLGLWTPTAEIVARMEADINEK